MFTLVQLALGPIFVFAASLSQLETDLKRQPSNLRLRQKIAKLHHNKKHSTEVIKYLAPFSNEINVESLRVLATAYRAKKDYSNEIQTLELYRQRTPGTFRPHYLLGRALRDNAQYDEAVEFLRKSIGFASKHRPSYKTLLGIFRMKKQNYESRILLNDMIRLFGARKEFLNEQCALFVTDGFLAEARKTCKQAVSKDRRHPDNHVHLAQTYFLQSQKKSAEKIYITAARQFPKSEYVQWAAGEYYYQETNFPIAVRYLKAAIKADPKKARSQLGLAVSMFEMGSYKEAAPHYLAACKLDKSRVAMRSFQTAAAKLRQEQNPDSPLFERTLAKCY